MHPMSKRIAIVLAAGKGTRLKSQTPKVMQSILGKPMLQRVLEALSPLTLDEVFLVVGHQEAVLRDFTNTLQETLPFTLTVISQEPQLGTGHAVMQVLPYLPSGEAATVLIACGDMPLLPSERYQALLNYHEEHHPLMTLTTVAMPDPFGYGRVLMKGERVLRIVEEKDASVTEKAIPWVNAGIYVVDWPRFAPSLSRINTQNAQGEFYLTDSVEILNQTHEADTVHALKWPDPDEILGINTREHISQAVSILSNWTAKRLMAEGVSLLRPETMVLAPEIEIGADTTLYPGCYLEGSIKIGSRCEIGPYTTMRHHIQIGDDCRVSYAVLLRQVVVGDHTDIGPFAYLRDNTTVGHHARIGNYVELKETQFGSYSNAAHLCYVGDAAVGDQVNMGAGSIIANYDPIRDQKHRSHIEDGVKVGCNAVVVSPVTLHERSCVAAGSVITVDVPPFDLAIARSPQEHRDRWVERTLNADPNCSITE